MIRRTLMPLAIAGLLAFVPGLLGAQDLAPNFVPKRAGVAIGISLIATVTPTVVGAASPQSSLSGWLFAYGMFLGPSTGYLYLGRSGRFVQGGLVRLGVSTATVLGMVAACGGDIIWDCSNEDAANGIGWLGLGAFTASAIYDIVSAGGATRRWNTRNQPQRLTVTPILNPFARSGSLAVRLAF